MFITTSLKFKRALNKYFCVTLGEKINKNILISCLRSSLWKKRWKTKRQRCLYNINDLISIVLFFVQLNNNNSIFLNYIGILHIFWEQDFKRNSILCYIIIKVILFINIIPLYYSEKTLNFHEIVLLWNANFNYYKKST